MFTPAVDEASVMLVGVVCAFSAGDVTIGSGVVGEFSFWFNVVDCSGGSMVVVEVASVAIITDVDEVELITTLGANVLDLI